LNLLINSYKPCKTITLHELFVTQCLTIGRPYELAVSTEFVLTVIEQNGHFTSSTLQLFVA